MSAKTPLMEENRARQVTSMVGVDIRTHATHSCTRVACDLSALNYPYHGQETTDRSEGISPMCHVPCTYFVYASHLHYSRALRCILHRVR